MISLLFCILIICGGYFLGRVFNKFWRVETLPLVFQRVIDVALGLGLLSLVFFFLCAVQQIALVLPLGIVLGAAGLCYAVKDALGVKRNQEQKNSKQLLFAVSGMLLGATALVTLITALAPSASYDWDSLAYHLAVPKLYLSHGGFYYIDFTSHSNFPFLMEMLYIPGLAVGLPIAAKLIHYFMGVMLVITASAVSYRYYGSKAAVLTSLIISGIFAVIWEATTAYVDLTASLYTILAVLFVLEYFNGKEESKRNMIVGAGLAVGFAASTKMTSLALIPLISLWFLIENYVSYKKINLKSIFVFVAIAIALCAPWYVKSLLYTGNPVYPFFYGIFGGNDWTKLLADNYSALQAKFGTGHDLIALIRVPYDIAFHSEVFYDTPGLYVGPILLVGILSMFFMKKDRKIIGLAIFSFLMILVWFCLTQQSRYLIPVFSIVAVIISGIVYSRENKSIRCASWAFAICAAIYTLYLTVPIAELSSMYAFSKDSKDTYLSKNLDIYPAQKWMNENLSKSSKVALIRDTRGFYLDIPYVWADPGHSKRFTRDYKSEDDYIAYLKKNKITHLMINYRFGFDDKGINSLIIDAIEQGKLLRVYPDTQGNSKTAVYEIL